MSTLNRSTRKPSISILLTIDDDGNNGRIRELDLDDDEDSYEVKKKIGKRLIKKLVRTGDVDRKPNFHNSDESGCQKQMNSKYDELMAALNSIVDRALQNDPNRIGQVKPAYYDHSGDKHKSPTVRRSTTPLPFGPDDDHEHDEHDSVYQYIMSINSKLDKLVENAADENPKGSPVKRYSQRSTPEMDYDGLAREILKGIGLDTDIRSGNQVERHRDEDYEMVRKHPIGTMSRDVFSEGLYDSSEDEDIDLPDEMAEFVPMRNLTKRHSFWSRDDASKLRNSLRKRFRFSREPSDLCVNCHRRMRRSDSNPEPETEASVDMTTGDAPTTSADPTTTADSTTGDDTMWTGDDTTTTADSTTTADPTTTAESTTDDGTTTASADSTTVADSDITASDEYLLHYSNHYGVDSEEEYEAAPESTTQETTESPMPTTTESSDNQSTLETSVTSTATEPSVTSATTPEPEVDAIQVTGTNTDALTISKNGIQIPLRLIRDSAGQLQFVLDQKAICNKCKCKCRRRKPNPFKKIIEKV